MIRSKQFRGWNYVLLYWLFLFYCIIVHGWDPLHVRHEVDDKISVLTIASRKYGVAQLPAYIASLIENPAASRLDLHFVVDAHSYQLLMPCQDKLRKFFRRLSIRKLQDYDNTGVGQHVSTHLKEKVFNRFHSAMYKLDVINLMPPDIDRVIILDVDMLVFEDLSYLWVEADRVPGKYLYMTYEGYQTDSYYTGKYNNQKKHFYKPWGVNGGLIIANLWAMRNESIDGRKFIEINDEYPRLTEQDIFNTWAYYNPEKMAIVPCRWNARVYVYCYDRKVVFDTSRTDRGIFHGNTKTLTGIFMREHEDQYAVEQGWFRNYTQKYHAQCKTTQESVNKLVQQAIANPDMKITER